MSIRDFSKTLKIVKLLTGTVYILCLLILIYLCLQFLAFTCGLVRGALSNLGVRSIVTAEVSVMPACKKQIICKNIINNY